MRASGASARRRRRGRVQQNAGPHRSACDVSWLETKGSPCPRGILLPDGQAAGEPMRDRDVRAILKSYLASRYSSDPSTRVVDEMPVCSGAARIDVAVINSHLVGFEIKSACDSLARLPSQIQSYALVFDEVTIVANLPHLARLRRELPRWCGLWEAFELGDVRNIREHRRARPCPGQSPSEIASLLWRAEALSVLERHHIADGVKSKPCRVLWRRLADELPLKTLRYEVRLCLKTRDHWRAD